VLADVELFRVCGFFLVLFFLRFGLFLPVPDSLDVLCESFGFPPSHHFVSPSCFVDFAAHASVMAFGYTPFSRTTHTDFSTSAHLRSHCSRIFVFFLSRTDPDELVFCPLGLLSAFRLAFFVSPILAPVVARTWLRTPAPSSLSFFSIDDF